MLLATVAAWVFLVLSANFLRDFHPMAIEWRFWAVILGMGAYCSLWLVGWALWRSPVTPPLGSRPPQVPEVP
jgi:hypothetical protein